MTKIAKDVYKYLRDNGYSNIVISRDCIGLYDYYSVTAENLKAHNSISFCFHVLNEENEGENTNGKPKM